MKYSSKLNFPLSSFYKNIELIIYLSIGFIAPLFIGHPQIIVGTIVNAILATSALRNVNKTKTIALAITPSLGVIMNGILFGNLTKFIIYFLPAIWISNFIYMTIIKLKDKKETKISSVLMKFTNKNNKTTNLKKIVIASTIKTSILFGTSILLVSIKIVPKAFLVAMSGIQILTALSGGGVAIGIIYLLNKTNLKN